MLERGISDVTPNEVEAEEEQQGSAVKPKRKRRRTEEENDGPVFNINMVAMNGLTESLHEVKRQMILREKAREKTGKELTEAIGESRKRSEQFTEGSRGEGKGCTKARGSESRSGIRRDEEQRRWREEDQRRKDRRWEQEKFERQELRRLLTERKMRRRTRTRKTSLDLRLRDHLLETKWWTTARGEDDRDCAFKGNICLVILLNLNFGSICPRGDFH